MTLNSVNESCLDEDVSHLVIEDRFYQLGIAARFFSNDSELLLRGGHGKADEWLVTPLLI